MDAEFASFVMVFVRISLVLAVCTGGLAIFIELSGNEVSVPVLLSVTVFLMIDVTVLHHSHSSFIPMLMAALIATPLSMLLGSWVGNKLFSTIILRE